MNLKKVILLLFLTSSVQVFLQGQDIHYSQFLYSPHNLNPGMTGNFDGRYRVAFNHRQQWQSFINPYQTTSIGLDARDFLNLKNFGLGLNFFYDQVGTTNFKTLQFNIPVSYRIGITKDSVHSITLGLQAGLESQSLDGSQSTFGSQYNGNRYDGDLAGENVSGSSARNAVFAAGAVYNLDISRNLRFKAGVGIYNLNQPDIAFTNGATGTLERRFNYQAGATVYLSPVWFITPGIIHSNQGEFRETVIGTELNYEFDAAPYRYRALFLGAWNRNKDAAIADIGFYYNSWRVGFSYDVNYSQLETASANRGGWEVSVIYILRELLPKRSNYKYCPNFL
ncbi:PorP/SprF family type IX secretion system membrane protein [Salibacteraceae bacterium]|nr:PorP/SprF family type IX secretion system membrane protein [Salibacteraceae bacterium]